jgi:hypothetical protein
MVAEGEARTHNPIKTNQYWKKIYTYTYELRQFSRYSGSIPGRGKRSVLLNSVQTGSGAHPASYPMGTGGSIPEG